MKIENSVGLSGRVASRWFAKLRSTDLDGTADKSFRRWLEQDPLNELEFEKRELLWELVGDLAEDIDTSALVESTLRQVYERQRAHRSVRRWLFCSATLAACLVAAVLLWVQPHDFRNEQTITTGLGEQRRVVLTDGTRVVLNTNTRLRIRFKSSARDVYMDQGEATFSVTHDIKRPFEVYSGAIVTRDLGTQFNVLNAENVVEVSVLSGTVQMLSASAESIHGVILTAGRAASFTSKEGLSASQPANLARIEAWQAQRIDLHDVTLAAAVAEFNRYSSSTLVVADPALGQTRVSGVFRIGDEDAFVKALDAEFGVWSRKVGSEVRLEKSNSPR